MTPNGWWVLLLAASTIGTGLACYRQGWCDGQRDAAKKVRVLARRTQ